MIRTAAHRHHLRQWHHGSKAAVNCAVRAFRTSTVRLGQRAIVYSNNGDPSYVLSAVTFPNLPPPAPGTTNIRFLLSAINPADINVIEGVYPARPSPSTDLSSDARAVFVAGNEGVAEVLSVGDGVTELKERDWVVMTKPQMGTWASGRNVRVEDVLKVDSSGLSAVQAATLTVNPPTAYNMLHDFVQLKEGDWVVQNGANSAVGQAVIQIAASKGFKTINFIRNRDNVESLKSHLKALGATHVATYDELLDRAFRATFSSWTQGKAVKLGLNCVGGKTTTLMARLLGENSHLVSYGSMSKDPLSLPTSLFIFKNLTCHGFWQTRWYDQKTLDERLQMMHTLTGLIREGKLGSPEHEILVVGSRESDSDAREIIRTAISRLGSGKYGKKVLLKVEETQ
ncbi:NAD(P)-binding protein [Imleria badia]|nr:NAD(P)-binding protein [Imleria badia]